MLGMVDVELIKKMHERDHSIRDISRMTGWSRQTVRKTLAAPAEPPVYDRSTPRPCPAMDPYMDVVRQWIGDDESAPRKQRHTAKRVFDRLVDEYAFAGSSDLRAASTLILTLLVALINKLSVSAIAQWIS